MSSTYIGENTAKYFLAVFIGRAISNRQHSRFAIFYIFSFVLNFQFLTYSFAHIVPIIDKNNMCKFRSHSSKIEKNAISDRQHPRRVACYILFVCARF